ncbi:TPA: hypothetical protein N0F65_006103, partial [Lagenidium giganteum]
HHKSWRQQYLASKSSVEKGYDALQRLLLRFAVRNGFSYRTPSAAKVSCSNAKRIQQMFAIDFWCKYTSYNLSRIVNLDETGIFFDIPPRRIWAVRGDSSRILATEKHSARLTAVVGLEPTEPSC